MGKRVSGNYYIPNLSKGLIDGSSKGRIDDDYKKKCSELTNFWIKNNNNIAKRPPLRPVAGLEDLRHIIDVTETADRIVFLRQVDLNIPTDDEDGNPIRQVILQHRRRTLLEEIGWRTGVATQVGEPGDEHIDYISPDDPVNFQLWHYGTAPDGVARDDGASVSDDELRELYPIVTVLDSYDKETHEHYLDERFYFVQWIFSNHQDSTEFRFGLDNAQGIYQADPFRDITVRSNIAYGGLTNINKTPLAAPAQAVPNTDENTAARLLAHRQSTIFREYIQGLEAAPIHTFIINKGEVIDSRVVHDLKHHPEYGAFLNEIPTGSISRASLNQLRLYDVALQTYASDELLNIQENLFRDTSLPERVFTNHSGRVELYAFGLDYTWNKEELAPRLKSSEDLSESIMNTFVEKPTQINVDELEIQADIAEVYQTRTNLTPGSTPALLRRVNPRLTLDDLINEIPDISQIRDHLKFSLCNIANEVSTDPTYGNYSYIIPDLQIPISGTDIPAYGQFLFKANYQGLEYNVFVMPYTYNQFYYDPKNPTPFRQTSNATFEDEDGEVDDDGNIITRREYPNGYGTGQGKAGVYLAFQINNEIGDDGIPVFYPIITTFDANQEIDKDNIEARTHYMVRLGLNLLDPKVREVMDDLKIISFYSSRGQNGFNAVGAVQIGNYVANRSLNGFEARGRESLYNSGSRDGSFGRAVNISETGRHVLPWGNPDLFSIFWLYATSQPPTIGNQPRPVEKESQTAAGNVVFSWNTEAGAGTPVGAIDKSTDLFRNFDNSVLGGTESEGQGKRVYLLNQENNRLRTSLADTSAIARKALDAVSEGAADIEALLATTVFYSVFISDDDGIDVQRRIFKTSTYPQLMGDYFYLGDTYTRYPANILSESDFTDDPSIFRSYLRQTGDVTLADVISANANALGIQDALTNRVIYTARFDTGTAVETEDIEILTYYNNTDTRSITVTEGTATRTFDVTRDATSANYYLQLRSNFQNELNSVGSLRGGEFYPESTVFLNYHPSTASVPFEADNRVAKAAGNTLAFSNTQEPLTALENAKFSQGYLRFLNSIITVGRHSGYIRAANLGIGISPFDRTRSPSEPQSLVLFNKDLSPVNIVDYVETARGGLAITDRRIYSISGFTSKITGRIIHESGFTQESLSDDSFVIGAEGDKIKAIRYYEEAGGYVTDIVNSELQLPGNILQGVSLLDKHKVLLFRCENTYNAETGEDTLYTLSVDNTRRVKGFTKFTVPCEVSYLTRIDKDRVGIVTRECKYLELDFNKDYNTEEGKWQDRYNGAFQTYECAFTPLPVLQVYADDFSVLKTTTLRYLVVGCNGHPAFDIQVVDGNTGRITRKTSFRRIRPNTVTVDSDFSGQVAVKNMPQNGSSQPELRISKTDDEYIEFSSINIQLGG